MNVGSVPASPVSAVEHLPPAQALSAREPAPAQEPQDSPPPVQAEPDNAAIQRMIEEIRNQFNTMNLSLNFSTYGKNNERIAIQVVDKETGKVVREIPPKELQHLSMKFDELIGLLFNASV
ncbi:MAG TPA: flagellar protein FlaG [Syntrophales bacterium]|nr:flagellar protein FlaG [Syntrophales bacterium]